MATPSALPDCVNFSMRIVWVLNEAAAWRPRDVAKYQPAAASRTTAAATASNFPMCFLASPITIAVLLDPLPDPEEAALAAGCEPPLPGGRGGTVAFDRDDPEPAAALEVCDAKFAEFDPVSSPTTLIGVRPELESRCKRFKSVRRSAAV